MKRLNITLPEDVASEIENFPNKSRFIAQAVKEIKKNKKGKVRTTLLFIF